MGLREKRDKGQLFYIFPHYPVISSFLFFFFFKVIYFLQDFIYFC